MDQDSFIHSFSFFSLFGLFLQSAELNRLAFYFDPDTDPWPMEKWEELLPKEWNKVIKPIDNQHKY
jgi:hypothetical protein